MTRPVPYCRLKLGIVIALATVLVAGCAAPRRAPVIERAPQAKPAVPVKPAPAASLDRPAFHTVRKGETLYSIALEYGLDYRELAEWNNVDPAKIQAGQQLRLIRPEATVSAAPLRTAPGGIEARPLGAAPGAAAPAGAPAAPLSAPPAGPQVVIGEPKGVRVPYSDQAYGQIAALKPDAGPALKPEARAEQKPDPVPEGGDLHWLWPAAGKVIGTFNGSTTKGIAIAGRRGQPVLASAAGKVIHSGTGIRGLGKFIVIKHNDAFLSVYAHNSQLLVKEGDAVARGQKIAEMGDSDADQVKLHFEIRRFGKPVDPARLLPDRPA